MSLRPSAAVETSGPSRWSFAVRVAGVAVVAVAAILTTMLAPGTLPLDAPGPMATWAGVSGT